MLEAKRLAQKVAHELECDPELRMLRVRALCRLVLAFLHEWSEYVVELLFEYLIAECLADMLSGFLSHALHVGAAAEV